MVDVARIKPYIPNAVGSALYLTPYGGYLLSVISFPIYINPEFYKKVAFGYLSIGLSIGGLKAFVGGNVVYLCMPKNVPKNVPKNKFEVEFCKGAVKFLEDGISEVLSTISTYTVASCLYGLGDNKINLKEFAVIVAGAFAAQPVDPHLE